MDYLRESVYSLLRDLYIYSREKYDVYFAQPTDFKIVPRSLSLLELNKKDTRVTKHDITVEIKDKYVVKDIHDFISKSQVPIAPAENEYFLVVEYTVGENSYKYLRPIDPAQPVDDSKQVFPVYTSEEIAKFNQESVANGVLLSSVNDTIDITDELHKHSGPKGNFYTDLDDHSSGFKLDWIPLLEDVPSDVKPTNVEILTYHGKNYVFNNVIQFN